MGTWRSSLACLEPGKTTLSSDPNRALIGDDEHGWTSEGVFNMEGGCYAKTIHLDPAGEPQIHNAIKYGAMLENIGFEEDGVTPNYDDDSITPNTRVSYPIHHIHGAVASGQGGHPTDIFFLTCDAFGVLPPLAKLNKGQAMYHFCLVTPPKWPAPKPAWWSLKPRFLRGSARHSCRSIPRNMPACLGTEWTPMGFVCGWSTRAGLVAATAWEHA